MKNLTKMSIYLNVNLKYISSEKDNKILIMIEISLNEDQKKDFQKNGFLIIESFLDTANIERLYESFNNLFIGKFETGIEPDEWNWKFESGPKDVILLHILMFHFLYRHYR